MADTSGYALFPGINQVRRCRYTRGIGTMPDVAHLEIVPQAEIIAYSGTLVMFYNEIGVEFPKCKIDRGSFDLTVNGHVMRLNILDRRWVWRFKHVRGHYNVKFPDGTIVPGTERTPQFLASILLTAMGETGYNVSLLPNFDRPTVDWDYANAADALSRLCEERGCLISLDLDDRVRLYPLGFTAVSLPTFDVRTASFGIDSPERPDRIILVGGRTLVQSKLLLAAIGIDIDGSLQLLDNLSYTPSAGWGEEDETFGNVLSEFGEAAQALAKRSVYRWYIVKAQADGGQTIPGYQGDSVGLWQILPIRDVKIDTYTDFNGIKRPLPASVEGVYFKTGLAGNTTANTEVATPATLDPRLGIVKFSTHVFKIDSSGKPVAADLYLTTSYHVQHAYTRHYERLDRFITLGNAGYGEEIIRRPDLVQVVVANYSTSSPTNLTGVTNNFSSVNNEAYAHLAAAALNFQGHLQLNLEYRGILPISTNGQNRQVTWEVDMNRGFKTWVYANNESEYGVLSLPERRRIETVRNITKSSGTGRSRLAPAPEIGDLPGGGGR
jgi:hypothetical protein